MTPFIAAYLIGLLSVTARAFLVGDARDALTVLSVWIAQGVVYAALFIPGANAVGATGLVWALHATVLLVAFTKPGDTWVALLSASIAILSALALFGLLPSERGQGVASNFWHFSTLATWGQIGVMWISLNGRAVRVD